MIHFGAHSKNLKIITEHDEKNFCRNESFQWRRQSPWRGAVQTACVDLGEEGGEGKVRPALAWVVDDSAPPHPVLSASPQTVGICGVKRSPPPPTPQKK